MTIHIKKHGLTVTAPEGAVCGLHPNVPSSTNFSAIDPGNAIAATAVTVENGRNIYFYADLEPGYYHVAASLEGHYSVCQMINFTAEKAAAGFRVDLRLDKMAGNGYEAGSIMLNSQEFLDKQLISHKDTWGKEYARLFQTPQFLRPEGRPGRHQQTTNEEVMDFIAKLDAKTEYMHVFSLGKSPKYGYDMPLVLFTREKIAGMTLEQAAQVIRANGKPTVQYTAQCHSAEPVSTEGALAMMLDLCGDYGKQVLDSVDVYIIPRINPDGAFEAIRRSPATGEDMNRDYLHVFNQEIRMVISAYNLFLPEIAIDGHEKRTNFLSAGDAICTDMELQTGAGSLNHPAAMTELTMKIAHAALLKAKERGLRGHFYTKLASAMGGYAGSSYGGARNSLSFLVETPGALALGMLYMERRVMAQYTLASTVIDYAVENAREVMETVHSSREHMAKTGAVYDENDVIVLEHAAGETGRWETPLIHVPSGEVIDPSYSVAYTEHIHALRTRPRATAYLVPVGTANEEEILRVLTAHAVKHYVLPAGTVVKVRQYIQEDGQISPAEEEAVHFEQGAYVFPNNVPSTILGAIMEPDFYGERPNSTLRTMGIVTADENGRFPIYRYCHDLRDGKVTAEA